MRDMALKSSWYFYQLMEKPPGRQSKDRYAYYQAAQWKRSINKIRFSFKQPNRKRWGVRLVNVIKHLPHRAFFFVIPSLEGWPTKANEAPYPHEVRRQTKIQHKQQQNKITAPSNKTITFWELCSPKQISPKKQKQILRKYIYEFHEKSSGGVL